MKSQDKLRKTYSLMLLLSSLRALTLMTLSAALIVWLIFGVACIIESQIRKVEKQEKLIKQTIHLKTV